MCKNHTSSTGLEGIRHLGTVRGHVKSLVKVQPQLSLIGQDERSDGKKLRLGTIKAAYERPLSKHNTS